VLPDVKLENPENPGILFLKSGKNPEKIRKDFLGLVLTA
jgi:hypothetical protein